MNPRLSLLFVLAAVTVLRAADPNMTPAEREKVIGLLQKSRERFLATVAGLSDEQWKWKPSPERWSVGECAEHIVLAEQMLFGKVQEALANLPNPDWEKKTAGKTEFIERVMPNRTGKAQAPEPVVPQGHMTRQEVMEKFATVRERTLQFTRETQSPLKQQTAEHPFPVFNTLNAYQWLIFIPLHNLRHVLQMEEVKASAGFPK
jgi:hypothetical protein